MIIPLNPSKIIIGEYVREWCKLPYPDHPHGCPMYGKRESCPPKAPMFSALVDPPYYLVIQEFDLEAQAKRMKERHPKWSERQCRCLLYWQRGLMKRIMNEARAFLWSFPEGRILERPEANGVNLFTTCRLHGIILERKPQKTVKKMVLVGKRKERSGENL